MRLAFNMRILTLTAYYLPGFKGGGPIRTIANLVSHLGQDFHFSIITSDRDLGDKAPYPNIAPNKWQKISGAQVCYITPHAPGFFQLIRTIYHFDGDALYLNSFFSFKFSILPLLVWRIFKPCQPVVIGPRGEFSLGALTIKKAKKNLFVSLAKLFKIYQDVVWQASTLHEANDIRRTMGDAAIIRLAVDIAFPAKYLALQPRKNNEPLRLLFLSRISPKKNLLGAIEMLQNISSSVVLDVYGPIEDADYWATCLSAATKLPKHVHFKYINTLNPTEVPATMAAYDLFYFPTWGENFGHVIAEALGCGLPVLVADTTPWRDLQEKNLGWDISLNQPEKFIEAIENCSRKTTSEYEAWRHQIRNWALEHLGSSESIEQNRQLFTNLRGE